MKLLADVESSSKRSSCRFSALLINRTCFTFDGYFIEFKPMLRPPDSLIAFSVSAAPSVVFHVPVFGAPSFL